MTRILIVEDEGIIARDIQRQLLDLGYDPVDVAVDGEEAHLIRNGVSGPPVRPPTAFARLFDRPINTDHNVAERQTLPRLPWSVRVKRGESWNEPACWAAPQRGRRAWREPDWLLLMRRK